MKCSLCEGTTYVKVPTGMADCIACEEGRRRVEAREAHQRRYQPMKKRQTFRPKAQARQVVKD